MPNPILLYASGLLDCWSPLLIPIQLAMLTSTQTGWNLASNEVQDANPMRCTGTKDAFDTALVATGAPVIAANSETGVAINALGSKIAVPAMAPGSVPELRALLALFAMASATADSTNAATMAVVAADQRIQVPRPGFL